MQTQKNDIYNGFKITAFMVVIIFILDFCITYSYCKYLKYQEQHFKPNIIYAIEDDAELERRMLVQQEKENKEQQNSLKEQQKFYENADNFQNPIQLNSFQKELNSKNVELQLLETEIKPLKENLSFHEKQDYKKQFDIPIPNPFQLPITHKESLPQKTKKPFMEFLKDYENISNFGFPDIENFYKKSFSNGYSLEDLKAVFFSLGVEFEKLRLFLIEVDYNKNVFGNFYKFYSLNDFIKSSYTENELDKLFKDKTIPQQILSKRNLLIQIENMENTKQQITLLDSNIKSLTNEISKIQTFINAESIKPLYDFNKEQAIIQETNEKIKTYQKNQEQFTLLNQKKTVSNKRRQDFSSVPKHEKIDSQKFFYVYYTQFKDLFSFQEYFTSLRPTQNPLKHFIVLYDFFKNCLFSYDGKFMGYSVGWKHYYRFIFYSFYTFFASILFFIYSCLVNVFPLIKIFYVPFEKVANEGASKGLFNYLWDILSVIISCLTVLLNLTKESLGYIPYICKNFISNKTALSLAGANIVGSIALSKVSSKVATAFKKLWDSISSIFETGIDFAFKMIPSIWGFVISIFQGTLTVSLNSTNFIAVFFLLILKFLVFLLQTIIKIIKYPFIIILNCFFHVAECENSSLILIQNTIRNVDK